MKIEMFKRTISAIGLALCLVLAGQLIVPSPNFQDIKSLTADNYQLFDENLPEKK